MNKYKIYLILYVLHAICFCSFLDQTVTAKPPNFGVVEFVHKTHIHGIPYDQASYYGPSEVPILTKMLNDVNEEAYWENIIGTLGLIGDPSAIEPLLEFLNKPVPGQLSNSHYRAKMAVPLALGYIINKSKNKRALDYLQNSLSVESWKKRELSWIGFSDDEYLTLVKKSILGLGLAGNNSALKSLNELKTQDSTVVGKEFTENIRGVLDYAIKVNKIINKIGLKEYYNKKND